MTIAYFLLSLPPRRIHIGNRPINPHSISFIRLVAGNARARCCTLLFFIIISIVIIIVSVDHSHRIPSIYCTVVRSPRDKRRGRRFFFFLSTFYPFRFVLRSAQPNPVAVRRLYFSSTPFRGLIIYSTFGPLHCRDTPAVLQHSFSSKSKIVLCFYPKVYDLLRHLYANN